MIGVMVIAKGIARISLSPKRYYNPDTMLARKTTGDESRFYQVQTLLRNRYKVGSVLRLSSPTHNVANTMHHMY